ncbi:unnamed protein product, partial [Didymodactylos carnosus]
AWILTNGSKNEVGPRLVGEVVYKNKLKNKRNTAGNNINIREEKNIYAIGVSNWANIKNREELIRSEKKIEASGLKKLGELSESLVKKAKADGSKEDKESSQRKNVQKKKRIDSRQELEPNHTQFILFDDGTLKPSYEDHYRENLARVISCGAQRASKVLK